MRRYINRIRNIFRTIDRIDSRLDNIQRAAGRIETRQLEKSTSENLQSYEFKVFSQWGEDGIIQYLVRTVPIPRKVFVEIGVEDYTEANTRFLLQNNYWSGLVIDGVGRHIDHIKSDPGVYWAHNLKAECAFVTKENINQVLESSGLQGDIGLLSIDIDGNDYWIWEAIQCIQPRVVICEYNSLYGAERKIVTPYSPQFSRREAHSSNIYYGASLAALADLASKKGYALVGTGKASLNSFFVRHDVLGNLKALTAVEAYSAPQIRESMDAAGQLTYLSVEERLKQIGHLPVIDIDTGSTLSLRKALSMVEKFQQ
jgi:hypothetical protein